MDLKPISYEHEGTRPAGYLADGSGGKTAPGILVVHEGGLARHTKERARLGEPAAGTDWQLQLYGGVGHSFTNRDIDSLGIAGFAYHPTADSRSWRAMLDRSTRR